MNDKIFLDTNIYLYLFDRQDIHKQKIAFDLIRQSLQDPPRYLISFQVIQEFLNVALKDRFLNFSSQTALEFVENTMLPNCGVVPSYELYTRAVQVHQDYRFSFYDSLILAGAQESHCQTVYSEDMQPGRVGKNMTIINPFKNDPSAPRRDKR